MYSIKYIVARSSPSSPGRSTANLLCPLRLAAGGALVAAALTSASVQRALAVAARFGLAAAYATLFLYSAELFPAVVRNQASRGRRPAPACARQQGPLQGLGLNKGVPAPRHIAHECCFCLWGCLLQPSPRLTLAMTRNHAPPLYPPLQGLAASNYCARLGSLLAPGLAVLEALRVRGGNLIPLAVAGGVCVAAGCVALGLPETLGSPPPETIQVGGVWAVEGQRGTNQREREGGREGRNRRLFSCVLCGLSAAALGDLVLPCAEGAPAQRGVLSCDKACACGPAAQVPGACSSPALTRTCSPCPLLIWPAAGAGRKRGEAAAVVGGLAAHDVPQQVPGRAEGQPRDDGHPNLLTTPTKPTHPPARTPSTCQPAGGAALDSCKRSLLPPPLAL